VQTDAVTLTIWKKICGKGRLEVGVEEWVSYMDDESGEWAEEDDRA